MGNAEYMGIASCACATLAGLVADEVRAHVIAVHENGSISVLSGCGNVEWQNQALGAREDMLVTCATVTSNGRWPPNLNCLDPCIHTGYASGEVCSRIGATLLPSSIWLAIEGSGVSSLCCMAQ